MDTLGAWLRQTREARGSTLGEAAAATRIRIRLLESLEEGDFAAFGGGDVQVRGFLRIYARYLGLSTEEVLARYEAEVYGVETTASRGETRPLSAAAPTRPLPPISAPTRPMPSIPAATRPMSLQPPAGPVRVGRPRRLTLDRLVIGVAVVAIGAALVAGVYWLARRNLDERATPPPTATRPAEAGLPPAAPSTAPPVSPMPTPTVPANPQGGVELALEATEHVWVRVAADGQKVFEGMMASGQTETWSGQELVLVETGNGAGLQVTVNAQPQGAMCGRAEVCTRGWGPTGEVLVP